MEKVLQKPVSFSDSEIENILPILSVKAHAKSLIYFDNAATSQKPQSVIDALVNYYSNTNANIHRGIHYLSQKASQQYDETRIKVQKFINASSDRGIVFVRGTTEGINLVSSTFGRNCFHSEDSGPRFFIFIAKLLGIKMGYLVCGKSNPKKDFKSSIERRASLNSDCQFIMLCFPVLI